MSNSEKYSCPNKRNKVLLVAEVTRKNHFIPQNKFLLSSLTIIVELHGGGVDLGREEGEEEIEVVDGEGVGDDVPALGG